MAAELGLAGFWRLNKVKLTDIAESYNGSTHPSGGCYLGPNPSSAANRLRAHSYSNSRTS